MTSLTRTPRHAALRLLVVASAAVTVLSACSSSGGSSSGDSGGASPAGTTGASAGGSAPAQSGASSIAGQRFNFVMASSPEASKVVEVHAVNLLKAQGVKTSIRYETASPQVAIAQLQAGDIDAFSESLIGDLHAIAAGVPEVDFALAQPRQDYVLIGKKDIPSLADLKGANVGISSISGVNPAQVQLALQEVGLTAKDIHFVVAGGQSTRAAALLAGRLDATVLSHAFADKATAQGFHVLFDYTKQAPDLYDDNVFAMKDWLTEHKDLAIAFNKALLDSFVWFNDPANADAVVDEAMKIEPNADRADVDKLFKTLRETDAYPVGTIVDSARLDRLQKLYADSGALEKTVPVEQWVDTSYAEQAKAQS